MKNGHHWWQKFGEYKLIIIICKEKDRTVVEYMLEQTNTPVGVSTYNKYSDIPAEYVPYLLDEEAIIKRLTGFLPNCK